MTMRKLVTRSVMVAASITGVAVVVLRGTSIGRAARRLATELDRRSRYLRSAWPGIRYRAAGRHPEIDVSDDVLADRVRSALGPLERRLDLPRVHVSVGDRVVILHGVVPADVDAHELDLAAHLVPGVRGVVSYLRIGLRPGDTRPSEGRAAGHGSSNAYETLAKAAGGAGIEPGTEERSVRAVLGPFMERLPLDEREHVLAHLPSDARALAEPPRRHGQSRLRTVDELDDEIERIAGVDPLVADALAATVLKALRGLVPEEVADVSAVLPAGLRPLWDAT